MSTYEGNPSLATAVKDRVTTTFQQAVTLYKHGRIDEVVAGCTLILQMDPLFDPAKKLLEKTRNPAAPIDVDALLGGGSADPLKEAREAMSARDFQRVVNITTEVLTNDLMNDEARTLGDAARERMEASPFVDQFAKKCEQHLATGNVVAANADLEKARSLDPTHPAVLRIQQMIAASQPQAPAAPRQAPSFVVDNPPPSGRSASQAADFGFTFEEDKNEPATTQKPAPAAAAPPAAPAEPDLSKKMTFSGFSFDAPSAAGFSFDAPSSSGGFSFDGSAAQSGAFNPEAPKAPANAEYDFSTASMETSEEDRKKIDQYLGEGDQAFDSGDYQQAIDAWSRIFLIDVTNDQASERIEKAKGRRRELEQKVEPVLTAAVQAYDRKDYDTARLKFNEVLRIDSRNQNALDYLQRLPEPAFAKPADGAAVPPPPPPAAPMPDIFADEPMGGGFEEPLATPSAASKPVADKKAAPAKAKAKKASKGLPLIPIIAAAALLVLAVGGWFAWSKFSKPAYDPKATQAVFKQVEVLTKQGQYDEAIALLQDVNPQDPQHDRAVLMIADLQHKKGQGSQLVGGRPAAVYYRDQIAAGRSAFDAHDYDGAKKSFEQAMRVKALPPDVRPLYDNAAQQVAKLDGAKSLFRARQYQDALGNLESLLQQDPQNPNIRRMIIDAHFNLGATALQEERLDDAIKEFDEVLKLDPTDELAKRSKELATRYNGQGKDLLFKIYVKYLPLRQVN